MNHILIGLVSFGAIFGGALIGLFVRRRLSGHHLSSDSQSAVTVSVAVIGTRSRINDHIGQQFLLSPFGRGEAIISNSSGWIATAHRYSSSRKELSSYLPVSETESAPPLDYARSIKRSRTIRYGRESIARGPLRGRSRLAITKTTRPINIAKHPVRMN